MQIENIKHHLNAIDTLSQAQFELWGPLTGWLAQLFVFPSFRRRGAGALLIAGAIAEARKLNRPIIYLYTSGTLPGYYEQLGWSRMEEMAYLGKRRVIMAYPIHDTKKSPNSPPSHTI